MCIRDSLKDGQLDDFRVWDMAEMSRAMSSTTEAVSYTHLDVYKSQAMASACSSVHSFFAGAGAGATGAGAVFLTGAFLAVFGAGFFSISAAAAAASLAGLAVFSGSDAFFLQHFCLAGASRSTAVSYTHLFRTPERSEIVGRTSTAQSPGTGGVLRIVHRRFPRLWGIHLA